jgi:hypothetical protein
MAFYENSLADLIIMTLDLPLQDYWGGTATGGTTSTIIDTSRYERDNYFTNLNPKPRIRIVSTTDGAAPKGEEREITYWVQNTGTFTASPVFTAAPASGDKYVVLSKYRWDDIKIAINMAIDSVSKKALIDKVDETITFQSDTYEYVLPDGFTHIYRISQEDSDGHYPYHVPPDQYRLLRSSTPRLKLSVFPDDGKVAGVYHGNLWVDNNLSDGKHVRIEGFARQPRLVEDDDICYLNPNYIVYKAAEYIHSSKVVNPTSDYDAHRTQAETCRDMANTFLLDTITRFPPDTKQVIY